MIGPGIIDNLLRGGAKAGAHVIDDLPEAVKLSYKELLNNPKTLSIDDYTKWVDEASKADGVTDDMIKALTAHADNVGRQINVSTALDVTYKNALKGSEGISPNDLLVDVVKDAGDRGVVFNIDEIGILRKHLNSPEFVAKVEADGGKIAAEKTASSSADAKSAFSGAADAEKSVPHNPRDMLDRTIRFRQKWALIGTAVAGALFATEYASDGAISAGATSLLVDAGQAIIDEHPVLGQKLIDAGKDGAVGLYDLSGTMNRAQINAFATALEKTGHPEEAQTARIVYALSAGLPGIALQALNADKEDRAEVVVSELCDAMQIERQELGEFLMQNPTFIAVIEQQAQVDLQSIFPDVVAANKEEELQAKQYLARLEQLEKKANVSKDNTLTDQFTNPMAQINSGSSISSAFDFAQNNADKLNLGVVDKILLSVVGFIAEGLCKYFGDSVGQPLQKFAMNQLGIDDKIAELQDNFDDAKTDIASRIRVPGMDNFGPEYDAELAIG